MIRFVIFRKRVYETPAVIEFFRCFDMVSIYVNRHNVWIVFFF